MTPSERITNARQAGRTSLSEADAKAVLGAFGMTVPRSIVLQSAADIDTGAAALRPPYALKVMSPSILHKSDAGGVRLGLSGAAQVRDALAGMLSRPAIRGHPVDGFLLEEMAPAGHELVIGGSVHAQFGPVLMLGLGGIFVETLADVTFRLCPLNRVDAEEMIDELRGARILRGARGGLVANRDRIVDALIQVGGEAGLMCALGDEIVELDVNPLIVDAASAVAVDARILLAPRGRDA